MGNLWTEEQKQVIWLRNRNILVSAAAGSGKTAVLVERILQKITDREHPVAEDVRLHLGVPAAGLMPEVRAGVEQRGNADFRHDHSIR